MGHKRDGCRTGHVRHLTVGPEDEVLSRFNGLLALRAPDPASHAPPSRQRGSMSVGRQVVNPGDHACCQGFPDNRSGFPRLSPHLRPAVVSGVTAR